jgi:hypothetical protein
MWFRYVLVALLSLTCASFAQRRDPLTEQEVDQMRDTAQNPNQRFKLYTKFIEARLLAIDQLRADPKMTPDRGARIHDLLQDVSTLTGEADDNIDAYERQNLEMRKGLQELIQSASGWQLRLRALKDASAKQADANGEARDYYFVLDSAIDSVNELVDDARQTLQELSTKKKH